MIHVNKGHIETGGETVDLITEAAVANAEVILRTTEDMTSSNEVEAFANAAFMTIIQTAIKKLKQDGININGSFIGFRLIQGHE